MKLSEKLSETIRDSGRLVLDSDVATFEIIDLMAEDIDKMKRIIERLNAQMVTKPKIIPQLFEHREWEE